MPNQSILILSKDEVKKALPMKQAIELMKDAFAQLSSKEADVPLRTFINAPEHAATGIFMPVYLPNNRQFGLKMVAMNQKNPQQGLPMIQAMMLVMDAENGQPLALMDGEYLTALRTGAAAGLATDLFARKNAEVAAIFGAGAQARTQLEAIAAVRSIKRCYVFNRDFGKAEKFITEMSARLSIEIVRAESQAALSQADIICTATGSFEPVFSDGDLKPGVHINAIGAYRRDMREIPSETVVRAKVVVDQREACLSEAGDVIIPLQQGLIDENHIHAEIGEVVLGQKPARESESEITLFKSVGNAVQDLAAASRVIVNAERDNLGKKQKLY